MKNSLADLNNALFEQMERLNDDDLTDAQLDAQLKKADAIVKIAGTIIQNGELAYKTMKHMDEYGYNSSKDRHVPSMLEVKD